MITLKDWLSIVNYRITEGGEYGWKSFGTAAYTLDSWNGDNTNGYSLHIIFDTHTQIVYQVEAHDFKNARAYSYTNPDFKDAYDTEANARGYSDIDYDEYQMTALGTLDDWVEKATAIVKGEDYDARIVVPLNFSEEELFTLMKMAHEMDLSLNKFVEHILTLAIEQAKVSN